MTPYTLHQGDCRDVMAGMEADSVDAIVCDPPYGLGFMGKGWDHGVPGVEFWQAAKRVAKPGAHLLAFGGTRTFHRLTVAIEDAGWEIRDCVMYVYGSGFPKSLDVSKAIDAAAGAEREPTGRRYVHPDGNPRNWAEHNSDAQGYHEWQGTARNITAPATPEAQQWQGWGTALKPAWEPIIVARKPLAGTVASNVLRYGTGALNIDGCRVQVTGQRPIMEAWESDANLCDMCAEVAALNGKPGRLASRESTAIKPAEQTSSVRAQQSLLATDKRDTGCSDGMSAESTATNSNTGRSGKTPTGRYQMATSSTTSMRTRATTGSKICASCSAPLTTAITNSGVTGRWPSNLIHDGSEDVVSLFPETASGSIVAGRPNGSNAHFGRDLSRIAVADVIGDSGSATRFFQQCKGSTIESWIDLGIANIAETLSTQQRQVAASALALVASEALDVDGLSISVSLAPSTAATASEFATISASVTRTIQSIGSRFWHELEPLRLTLTSNLVEAAVTREPTGTTTITLSRWKSDGSAEPVTFSIMRPNSAHGEAASASRLIYTSKASREDREEGLESLPLRSAGEATDRVDGSAGLNSPRAGASRTNGARNHHPTVKPTSLMRYLCRLVTPRDGIVLDPFMGSGSTGKAAILEGFRFIGIDLEPEYVEIARARCEWAMAQPRQLALEETA